MSEIILFDNEYITVEYHPENRWIYHTIHKPIGTEASDVEMLKAALNRGTEALKQYGISKWLSDDRKNGPLADELVEWGATDWNPRTIKAGWKYWANVVPQELVAAGTLTPVISNLFALGLRMQVFSNLEEAREWLSQMED